MKDLIHLLPDSVANQIAAGEVIQRPASVVKELVENAVDAGAKTIHVQIVDAGRTSIQVIDDGRGMSETDARLSFERHATSKITEAADLFALRTMGFRGEALASIAAVAQVELLTRREEDEVGTRLLIAGSRVTLQEPVACPVGSNFKVDNLFFNVPARRKFLKSNATELNNILTAFERIVLVYPDIHFTLHHNGAELLNLKPVSLRQRITDVFGRQSSQELLPVEVKTAMCRISGFVSKPEGARKKGGNDYFFVNGRFMRHPYFHKAVQSAFDRLVSEGMQVPYFLYFDVEPSEIDVNIHPTKTEIKFQNEQAIWQILQAAVRDAVGKFCEVPAIDFDTQGQPDIPLFDPSRQVSIPSPSYNAEYNPFKRSSAGSSSMQVSERASVDDYFQPSFEKPAVPQNWTDLYEAALPVEPQALEKSPSHYQYKGRYLMTAVKSGLMIIDQHRADVRVRYERYMEQFSHHVANSQRVLFPEVLQLSSSESVLMEQILPDLSGMGFDVSSLGGNSFAVNGIPADLEGLDPVSLLRQLVSDAAQNSPFADAETVGDKPVERLHARLALSLARQAAIPYGQVLSNDEMEGLINQLFACSNVNYTPDGKTILTILPQSDIERLLG